MLIYTDNGYRNRNEYLQNLSAEYNVDLDTIYALAELLGPNEDFDGLVTAIEDIADGC